MDVNKSKRLQETELRSNLDRSDVIEALKHGHIFEILSKSKVFKLEEFHDYFASQWKSFQGNIIQSEIKSMEASYPEPTIQGFAVHHKAAVLSADEGKFLGEELAASLKPVGGEGGFKAQTAGAVSGKEASAGADFKAQEEKETPEGLATMAEGTLSEWDQFMNDSWSTILDNQMMQNYQSRMGEMKQELDRIISLAKQGAIGAEFVLIALAKVNATKNGVLMSWMGQKAAKVNESLNAIATDLKGLDVNSSTYGAQMQMGQAKTRDGAYQLSLLQTDMQKVMQDSASTLETVHSMMQEINRTRREIIAKVDTR